MELPRWRAKPALWTLAGLAAALAVAVILVIGPWLLTRGQQDNLTAEQELSARNDVRTTLIQAVGGLALAGGLVLTYRTYLLNRSTTVTEVYTNAVEQLGHEKAPVRLGAIHALAHLGQDNPARRQTVIDVLCAYLRLPYEPPAADAAPSAVHEELQVRQTAQRSLATHLCTPDRTTNGTTGSRKPLPQEVFWPDMNIDLTNASLYDVHFDGLSVADATFEGATFAGNPNYSGNTTFVGATFNGEANFYQATFDRGAFFDRATFTGDAVFTGATFTKGAGFGDATFKEDAGFNSATFSGARFNGATFTHAAWFMATFTGEASFNNARFTGGAIFPGATFNRGADFTDATFTRPINLNGATVAQPNNPEHRATRIWPDGWTIRTDTDTPDTGRLVTDEDRARSDTAPANGS